MLSCAIRSSRLENTLKTRFKKMKIRLNTFQNTLSKQSKFATLIIPHTLSRISKLQVTDKFKVDVWSCKIEGIYSQSMFGSFLYQNSYKIGFFKSPNVFIKKTLICVWKYVNTLPLWKYVKYVLHNLV